MKTQYLSLPEGKIAFDDQGSGPLILCAPGIGDLRSQYRFLAPQLLEAGFRVVTVDNRGQGESSINWKDYSVAGLGSDILALIRHLDAGPAVIVGHSMAAGAAVWSAAEGPDLVRGLVLLGPAVHGEVSGAFRALFNLMFARPWGTAMWIWYYSTLYPTRKPSDWQEHIAAIRSNLSQPGRLNALRQMMSASKAASGERMHKVIAPALILMGSKDPDFKPPEKEAQWVAAGLNGTYQMIEGAGHYAHVEMPEITAPAVLGFLKTLQVEITHAEATS